MNGQPRIPRERSGIIAIMGTPVSSGNRGVLALSASLVELCKRADAAATVVLLLGHRDSLPVPFRVGDRNIEVPIVNCRLSPRSRVRDHLGWITVMAILYRLLPFAPARRRIACSVPWIGTIEKADLVGDIRGGDSFSDIYGMGRFLLGWLMAWTVLLVRGDIVQFPQTFGPYRHPVARHLARFLLKHSSVILARDRQSRQVAQDLVGPERTVTLSPDVAFALEPVPPRRIETIPPLEDSGPPRMVGLNVSGLLYNGGYTRRNMFGLKMDYPAFVHALAQALLAEQAGDLWLVPHTYAARGNVESDNEVAERLRAALPPALQPRVRLVTGEYDPHEIKWIIGQCDFFIGSRMHACIAALSQGIPCVGVAYSMKFSGVFETVGMTDWVIDARSVDGAGAVDRIRELYGMRQDVRTALRQQANAIRRQLDDTFSQLIEAMRSPRKRTE